MTCTNKIGIAILMSALLASHVSFAASCYEQSPNYISLGDKYFDLDNHTPLTASDRKILNSSLKKMVGEWKGKGTVFQCIGPESAPIAENKQLTLSAKIFTNSSNELHIDVEKYFIDNKTNIFDHLFLFGATNRYQSVSITPNKIILVESFRHERIKTKETEGTKQDSSNPPQTALDEHFSQRKIRSNIKEKFDKKSHIKGSKQKILEDKSKKSSVKKTQEGYNPFYEIIHTIEHNKTHFNYSFRRYINGSLAIEERWQLVRDR